MKRFDGVAGWVPATPQAQAIPPGAVVTTEAPARPASFAADLLVPLGQAVITGLLLASLVTFAAARLGYGGDLLTWWGGWALAISAVTWAILLGQHRRLLWAVERVTGRDLDGDGKAGKPTERLVIVNASQAQQEAAEVERAKRRSAFAAFVAALPARGTDARAWEPELGRPTFWPA